MVDNAATNAISFPHTPYDTLLLPSDLKLHYKSFILRPGNLKL